MFPPLRRASVCNGHCARRGAVNRQAVAGVVRERSGARPMWLTSSRRTRVCPLPALVFQANHVDEVVAADEHAARVDRVSEVDDGAVAFVLSCAAARHPPERPRRSSRLPGAAGAFGKREVLVTDLCVQTYFLHPNFSLPIPKTNLLISS